MNLKLTTMRALEYEERTGNDIVVKIQEIANAGAVTIRDVVELFEAMGAGYSVEMFDDWDATFAEKAEAILNEVKRFIGNSEKK